MSNMKIVSLVANEGRRVQAVAEAELNAVTLDLYAALEPLRVSLEQLRHDMDEMKKQWQASPSP